LKLIAPLNRKAKLGLLVKRAFDVKPEFGMRIAYVRERQISVLRKQEPGHVTQMAAACPKA
jgi:hypothetical protein